MRKRNHYMEIGEKIATLSMLNDLINDYLNFHKVKGNVAAKPQNNKALLALLTKEYDLNEHETNRILEIVQGRKQGMEKQLTQEEAAEIRKEIDNLTDEVGIRIRKKEAMDDLSYLSKIKVNIAQRKTKLNKELTQVKEKKIRKKEA